MAVVRTAGGQVLPIRIDELRQLVQERAGFVIEVDAAQQRGATWLLALGRDGGPSCRLHFDEGGGELWMANPAPEHIDIMLQIADALGGRVRNDEFQSFRAATDTYLHPDDEVALDVFHAFNRRLVQRRRRMNLVWWCVRGGALILLAAGSLSAWLHGR